MLAAGPRPRTTRWIRRSIRAHHSGSEVCAPNAQLRPGTSLQITGDLEREVNRTAVCYRVCSPIHLCSRSSRRAHSWRARSVVSRARSSATAQVASCDTVRGAGGGGRGMPAGQ